MHEAQGIGQLRQTASKEAPSSTPLARLADPLLMAALFIGFNATLGLLWAVGAVTAWTIFSIFRRKRLGLNVGWWRPVVVAYVLLRAVAAFVTGSATVYLSGGILPTFFIGIALIASVPLGRPVAQEMGRLLVPQLKHASDTAPARRVYGQITLTWGLLKLAEVGWLIWLLNKADPNQFVMLRALVNWPVALVVVFLSFGWAVYRLVIRPTLTTQSQHLGLDGRSLSSSLSLDREPSTHVTS